MFVRNPDLRHWSFLWKAFTREEFWYTDAGFLPHYRNYRPLILVWSWLDYHLFGLNPAPWHASIVAVHVLAVWLMFKVSSRLAGDSTSALLASALFGLTPVHVAAVVWMAGSGFVLGAAFGLAAFYLIMVSPDDTRQNWAGAIALYACALLSHESAIAFPALVACYAFLFYPDGEDVDWRASLWMRVRRAIMWSAPFAVVLILYMITRRLVLGYFVSNPYDYANVLTAAQDVLTVPLVLATYLTMLTMPWLTLPNHSVPPVSSAMSPAFGLPLAAIAIVVAAFLVFALRNPRRRLYLFCGAWIGITLAPMMLLHSVYHLVQDYYLYLPSVGWSLLLGDLLVVAARKNALARRVAFGAASVLLLAYATSLWRVQLFWHDDVAAARGYIKGEPDSVAWHLTLGTYLEKTGNLAEAEQEIKTAMSLEPDKTGTIAPRLKELHQYLGELLAERGDIDGAEQEFRTSMTFPSDEEQMRVSNGGGMSLYDQGLRDADSGRSNQAIQEMTQGLEILKKEPKPEYGNLPMRYVALAELYDSIGKQDQVQSVFNELDSMPAGELTTGLARASIKMKHSDKEGAEAILQELSDSYPTNPQVLIQLGDVQASLNQYAQALISYQRARLIWIGDAPLHASIAKALHATGRDREAVEQCRLALALGPHDWATQFFCAKLQSDVQSN